jgi:RNA polymerase sigma-70 factor, ECF subfamily
VPSIASAPTDEELMQRVQDDDAAAFAELYERIAPRAFRVAMHLLNGDRERSADTVQDGFISVWRSRDRYCPESGRVSAWALGVVRNRAIDNMRRNARHALPRSDDQPEHAAPDDVESAVAERTAAADLRSHVERLPMPQREVVVLAFYGQLSHTEIARHLALPVGTVKGRMRLGLTKLRHASSDTIGSE